MSMEFDPNKWKYNKREIQKNVYPFNINARCETPDCGEFKLKREEFLFHRIITPDSEDRFQYSCMCPNCHKIFSRELPESFANEVTKMGIEFQDLTLPPQENLPGQRLTPPEIDNFVIDLTVKDPQEVWHNLQSPPES